MAAVLQVAVRMGRSDRVGIKRNGSLNAAFCETASRTLRKLVPASY